MPPRDDSDWSDSDDGDASDLETSVLLGLPEGAIENQEDIDDAAVSRIGGYPAFLTSPEPPLSSAQCKSCSFPMELLVQLWCPFEESTMDRALYVFGCARSACQHKDGSVRAFRGLRFNPTYAEKLTKKEERRKEKEAAKLRAKAEEDKKKEVAKVNPFSMSATPGASSGLFGATPAFGGGLGTQLFGVPSAGDAEDKDDAAEEPPPSDTEPSESDDDSSDTGSESGESSTSLLQAPASTPSESSPWRSAPAYTPSMYLSTASEYVPPPPKSKVSGVDVDDGLGNEKEGKARKGGKDAEDKEKAGWDSAMEGYENSLEVDHVFERFARRVGYEGEQCIRYELGGTPLPYSHDSVFTSLFSSPSATSISQANSAVHPAAGKRVYDPAAKAILPCPRCGSKRVFECQLMPHLIHVLQEECTSTAESGREKEKWTSKTDEERKREVERILKGAKSGEKDGRGMEWGTCLLFSCEKDCCVGDGKKERRDCWAEELVLAQWEE